MISFTKLEQIWKQVSLNVRNVHLDMYIRAGWSESSLSEFWIAKDAKFLHAANEDWSDCAEADESSITKTRLFKYIENFTTKRGKFSDKKFWYFSYSCSKIDCGYSLEPPRWGGSNEYPQSMFLSRNKKSNAYPCKPQFYKSGV